VGCLNLGLDLEALNARMNGLLGTPFEDNGRGATLDCTGLALELWRAGGVELPDPVDADRAADALIPGCVRELPGPELGCLVIVEHPTGPVDHVGVLLAPGIVGHATRGAGVVRTTLRTLIGRCDGRRRTVRYYGPSHGT